MRKRNERNHRNSARLSGAPRLSGPKAAQWNAGVDAPLALVHQLESENAALRGRAVRRALEIQELRDGAEAYADGPPMPVAAH